MKVLTISGGGNKCAFATGAIYHLLHNLGKNYDGFVGVSAGAINSAFLSQYKSGEEKQAAEDIKHLWFSLTTENIYKRWKPFGKVSGLWKSSLFNSEPLVNLLKDNLSLDKIRSSGKMVSVGAVSLSSGKYFSFTQDNDDFIKAVCASAAFPAVLTPIKIGDEYFFDGGVKSISPIKCAIDLGATEIDLIMTSPEKRNSFFIENPNIFDLFKRAIDLSSEKIMSNDLEKVETNNKLAAAGLSNKKVIKMNVLQPYNNLTRNFLDFNTKHLKEMFYNGYERAQEKCQDW